MLHQIRVIMINGKDWMDHCHMSLVVVGNNFSENTWYTR